MTSCRDRLSSSAGRVGKKRIAIVLTVLSMGPRLLVLDEPSGRRQSAASNTPFRARRALVNLLRDLPRSLCWFRRAGMKLVEELFRDC